MNQNAEIIFMLCSHLIKNEEYKPFEPSEWSGLAEKLMKSGLQPKELPVLTDADFLELGIVSEERVRIRKLIDRGPNLTFELEKYENMGISVITRADAGYPRKLKTVLGKSCPPLFYYCGDLSVAENKCIGFVGSRNTDECDREFAEKIVGVVNDLGYEVVSGGAKGIDKIAGDASLQNGQRAVAYIADSMVKRIKNRDVISAVRDGRLLLMSAVCPDVGFTVATAMMRNRYIYAQSAGTVVVRSDYKKGGTWSGASDSIKHKLSPVLCWNNPEYKGNQELIRLGAVPIDENWDGDVSSAASNAAMVEEEAVQLSFFE